MDTEATKLKSLINRVPTPLAFSLNDYIQEDHPYIKLHRLCDGAEMACRFFTVIGLSELVRNGWVGENESFQSLLLEKLTKPTFGQWVGILAATSEALTTSQSPIAESFEREATRLSDLLTREGEKENRKTFILPLRNSLSHDGRFSTENSELFLSDHGHAERFESYWLEAADLLEEIQLYGVDRGEISYHLRGLNNFSSVNAKGVSHDIDLSDSGQTFVKWFSDGPSIPTSPLQTFRMVEKDNCDESHGAVHLYSKYDKTNLIYTVLHQEIGRQNGTRKERDLFTQHFPFQEWRERADQQEQEEDQKKIRKEVLKDIKTFRFRDVIQEVMHPFVGRERDVADVLNWIEKESSGIASIPGEAGIGKSAFSAHVSTELNKQRFQQTCKCFRHFFKNGDHRCSFSQFAQGLLLQLEEWSGNEAKFTRGQTNDELLRLLRETFESELETSEKRLVLVLDSIDELPPPDLECVLALVSKPIDDVVWLITARPSSSLSERFSESCAWFPFDDRGLPRLDKEAIRSLLIDSDIKYAFLSEEQTENRFLETLVSKADGIPLYIQLVIAEIEQEDSSVYLERPETLPQGLSEYYRALLSRPGMDMDPAKCLLPEIISLLALIKSPAPEETIEDLLSDHNLRKDREWSDIFEDALGYGSALIRLGYVWEGESGWTLYHESFREFLLGEEHKSYRDKSKFAPIMKGARRRVDALCHDWRTTDAGSYSRAYAIRYACKHFIESVNQDGVFECLTDLEYLEARLDPEAIYELLADFRAARDTLTELEKTDFIEDVGNTIETHGDFLIDHPEELFQCLQNTCLSAIDEADEASQLATEIAGHWEQQFSAKERPWIRRIFPKTVNTPFSTRRIRGVITSPCGIFVAYTSFAEHAFDGARLFVHPCLVGVVTKKGKQLVEKELPENVIEIPVSFCGDSSQFLLVGIGKTIRCWDYRKDKIVDRIDLEHPLCAIETELPGDTVALLTTNGGIINWRIGHGIEKSALKLDPDESLIMGDFTPGLENAAGCAVTTEDRVLEFGEGKILFSHALPTTINALPAVCVDEHGKLIGNSSEAADHQSSWNPIKEIDCGFFSEPSIAKETLEYFGSFLNPAFHLSSEARGVISLSYTDEYRDNLEFVTVFTVHFWAFIEKEPQVVWEGEDISCIRFDGGSKCVNIGLGDGDLVTVDLAVTGTTSVQTVGSNAISSISPSASGIMSMASGKEIRVIDSEDRQSQMVPHRKRITACCLSDDNQFFVTGDDAGAIAFWDAQTWDILKLQNPWIKSVDERGFRHFGHCNETIKRIEFIDSSHVVSIGNRGGVCLWNPANGELLQDEGDHFTETDSDCMISFSEDRKRFLAFNSNSNVLYTFAFADNVLECSETDGNFIWPSNLDISPDGEWIALVSDAIRRPNGTMRPEKMEMKVSVYPFSALNEVTELKFFGAWSGLGPPYELLLFTTVGPTEANSLMKPGCYLTAICTDHESFAWNLASGEKCDELESAVIFSKGIEQRKKRVNREPTLFSVRKQSNCIEVWNESTDETVARYPNSYDDAKRLNDTSWVGIDGREIHVLQLET